MSYGIAELDDPNLPRNQENDFGKVCSTWARLDPCQKRNNAFRAKTRLQGTERLLVHVHRAGPSREQSSVPTCLHESRFVSIGLKELQGGKRCLKNNYSKWFTHLFVSNIRRNFAYDTTMPRRPLFFPGNENFKASRDGLDANEIYLLKVLASLFEM